MDIYAKGEDEASTKKPWTEQEVLRLLEVSCFGANFDQWFASVAMLGRLKVGEGCK